MGSLREAAQQAMDAMSLIGADLVCNASHHKKKDQHGFGEMCPPQQRWHIAFFDLRAALAESAEPVSLPDGYEPHELPADYTGKLWIEGQVRALHDRAATPMRKPLRTVTYTCPVCAASLEKQE